MAKTNLQKAQEVVEQLGDGYRVYEGYSGRCMFGDTCLGIVGPSISDIKAKASRRGFKNHRTDNMGLDYIVYWPDMK